MYIIIYIYRLYITMNWVGRNMMVVQNFGDIQKYKLLNYGGCWQLLVYNKGLVVIIRNATAEITLYLRVSAVNLYLISLFLNTHIINHFNYYIIKHSLVLILSTFQCLIFKLAVQFPTHIVSIPNNAVGQKNNNIFGTKYYVNNVNS